MDKQLPWGYVALSEYSAPSAPLTEAAHKGLKRLWRRIWRGRTDASVEAGVDQRIPVEFFDNLFLPPDWEAAFPRLIAMVEEGFSAGQTAQVFVGGPHRCTPDMLRHLARAKRWPVIEAPAPEEILERRYEPANLVEAESVVVIPQLAHWFLRHDNGLDVIRDLLDWVQTRDKPVVLGCHSWAWSYLDKAIELSSALPEPRVLAPLDAASLRPWLQQLAIQANEGKTVFREASSGKIVLELNGSKSNAEPASAHAERSNLLAHIASQGRGLPEIIWSLWRESILLLDQKMLTAAALKTVSDKEEDTIWVPSWSQLKLPDLQEKPGHLPLFLMHNLLLHGGLPADLLPLLLPFPRSEILRGLRQLQARGMAEVDGDRWRVTAAGYPTARTVLNDECYLVDNL